MTPGPPATIVCVDCGGEARLLQPPGPDDELEPGDVVAYRCPDCGERFDIVLVDADLEPPDPPDAQ